MKNLNQIILNFKKLSTAQKLLIFGLLGVLVLYLISIIQVGPKPSSISTVPLTPTIAPQPLPTSSSQNVQNLKITWKNPEVNLPQEIATYEITNFFVSKDNALTIASNLNFKDSDLVSQDQKSSIWSSGNRSLSMDFVNHSLIYLDSTKKNGPTFALSNSQLTTQATEKINQLLASTNTPLFSHSGSLDYFTETSVYDTPSAKDKATLLRLGFTQQINSKNIYTQSETSAPLTVYFNRDLSVRTILLNNAIQKTTSVTILPLKNLEDLKATADQRALRLNTGTGLKNNFGFAASNNLFMNANDVEIGYLVIQNKLLPIYVLKGEVSTEKIGNQSSVYALPAY